MSILLEILFKLVRRSDPRIRSDSAKQIRSSAVLWFLPVKLEISYHLMFFLISTIFSKASGVALARKLNLF